MEARARACVYFFVVRVSPLTHPTSQAVSSASWRAHWIELSMPAAALLTGCTDLANTDVARNWGVATDGWHAAGAAALWRALVRWRAVRGKAVRRAELEATATQWRAPRPLLRCMHACMMHCMCPQMQHV